MLILCFSLSLREQVHGAVAAAAAALLCSITKSPLNCSDSDVVTSDPAPVGTAIRAKRVEGKQSNNKNSYNSISNELQNEYSKTMGKTATCSEHNRAAGSGQSEGSAKAAQLQRLPRNHAWRRSQSGNANCANYVGHKALRYLLVLPPPTHSFTPSLSHCCCRSFYCHNRF